jgi:tetratricopeptide (TPR) repeat protein
VQFQLGFAYFQQQRFDASVAAFERAAALGPPDYDLLVDWALAYDGLHQPEKALEKLRQAAALESTAHVYSQIGKIYAERGDYAQARIAFDKAQSIDANFAPVWAYKGLLSLATNDPAGAIAQFQRALELDPSLQPAREGLMQAQQRLRGAR